MSRLLKIVALAMLVVAVTASGAMAAGSLNISTAKTMEYKLTTNGTYSVQSSIVTGATVTYRPMTTLNPGDYVRFTLAGAKFKTGETVWLSTAASSAEATGTTTSATTVDIAVGSSKLIASTLDYYLTLSTATAYQMPTIIVDQGMAAGGSVTIAADAYNNVGQMYTLSSAAARAIITSATASTMTATFTDDATTLNRTIDVNQGRLRFTTTVPGNLTNAAKLVLTQAATDITIDPTSANFEYTLTVTGDLTGLTYIKLGSNVATTITTAMKTAGSAAITGVGGANATAGKDNLTNTGGTNNIVFTVDGSTVLSARTFTLSLAVTKTNETTTYGSTGTITPTAGSTSVATHVFLINGFQAVMPFGIANATYPTSCYINNPSANAADAYMDIVSTQSGASLTALTNLSLGSVPAYSTKRVNLDTAVTPYAQTGVAGTPIPLGLTDWDKYSVKFTVQGPNSSVTINCVQVDLPSTGAKRVVPVLTGDGTDYRRQ